MSAILLTNHSLMINIGKYEVRVRETGNRLSDEAFAREICGLLRQGPMDWDVTLTRSNSERIA